MSNNPRLETNIARVFCAEMLGDYGWDHVPNRTWHPSCRCSDTVRAGISIVCNPDDTVTELTMDASQLYLGGSPNHDRVLNTITIGGSASLVRVWANWSSTVVLHPYIQGNPVLERVDIDARNLTILSVGFVRGNPSLVTLNVPDAGLSGRFPVSRDALTQRTNSTTDMAAADFRPTRSPTASPTTTPTITPIVNTLGDCGARYGNCDNKGI